MSIGWAGSDEVDARTVVQEADSVHARNLRQLVGATVVGAAGERLDRRAESGGADLHDDLAVHRAWGPGELLEGGAAKRPERVDDGGSINVPDSCGVGPSTTMLGDRLILYPVFMELEVAAIPTRCA